MEPLKLSSPVEALLRCPSCSSPLLRGDAEFRCRSEACGRRYPIVQGVPVLIDETRSLFSPESYIRQQETTFRSADRALKDAFGRVMPRIGHNLKAEANYAGLAQRLLRRSPRPLTLVIGGSILGKGMEPLSGNQAIELVETDVALGPRTGLICDAHDLPFEDGTFDGVVAQAVLEHVLDPYRCVSEIHRVLKPDGLVYAETPFMQQVHMGPFDFTRFTPLGHRRLFRHFEELDSGAACGPGMALAWAWQYFLLSFFRKPLTRGLARGLAALTAFPLKYFDHFLLDRPGALDAASGVYFLGQRSEVTLPDRELVAGYRGAMR